MKETGDLTDHNEADSLIKPYHYTPLDTKMQRIVKTYLINFSFIALVSKLADICKILQKDRNSNIPITYIILFL